MTSVGASCPLNARNHVRPRVSGPESVRATGAAVATGVRDIQASLGTIVVAGAPTDDALLGYEDLVSKTSLLSEIDNWFAPLVRSFDISDSSGVLHSMDEVSS